MTTQTKTTRGFPGVALSVFEAGRRLQEADAGPSEWYLYMWLVTLANAMRQATLRTNTTMIRQGVRTPVGDIPPAKMALNTIKAALSNLEVAELITVTRTNDGRVMHLDITFE